MINKNIFFSGLLLLFTGNFFASQNLDHAKKEQEENKAPLYFLSLVRGGDYSQAAKFLIAESIKKDVDTIKKKFDSVVEEKCPIQ